MNFRERSDDIILGLLLIFAAVVLCLIFLKGGEVCLRLLDETPAPFKSDPPPP